MIRSTEQRAFSGSTGTAVVFFVCCIICLNVFATFNLPGRKHMQPGDLDLAGIIKVLVRAVSVAALGWIVFAHLKIGDVRKITARHSAWLLFTAWAITTTAWSPLKSFTLGQSGGQAVLAMLSICVAMSVMHFRIYLFITLLSTTFYCLVYGVGSLVLPDMIDIGRSSVDAVIHPTALGAASSLGLLIVFGIWLTSETRWLRISAWLLVPVLVVSLLAAHNRLSILLTVLVGTAMFVSKGRSHLLAAFSVVTCLFTLTYVLVDPGLVHVEAVSGTGAEFLQRGQSTNQLTQLSGRAEMWTAMWKSYLDAPILGHGYFVSSRTGRILVWHVEMNHTAHNVWLQGLVSTGLIGTLALFAWCLNVARMQFSIWLGGWSASSSRPFNRIPETSLLPVAVMFWFFAWTMLNASILGPLRPESVVFAVSTGTIAGRFHLTTLANKAAVHAAAAHRINANRINANRIKTEQSVSEGAE
ncbi:MAG: O-antigen ligase family protein [Planctomycetota bacterium]